MSLTQLSLPAPAKLNLFLHITGRRPDGYHTLQTLFQFLDLSDTLEFTRREDEQLQLSPALPGVAEQDNLVIRAAQALRDATGCRLGADIHLSKRLPMGGGIGGGSSDAATTLLGLNALWQLGLDLDTLADIGLRLGADVPVFVRGQAAWAEGVGEQLTPVELPEPWYLVVKPAVEVATAKIFSHPLLTRDSKITTMAAFLEEGGRNDCEAVTRSLHPEVDAAMNWLSQFGNAKLTGTGACIFSEFDSQEAAQQVARQAPSHLLVFVARGHNRSPAHTALEQQTHGQ